MKNSNLLNRLLSYSHEKQSPQRFARYAAMLIMLLTLGVGQMWGVDYILGPDGDWTQNTTHQMVSSGITDWVYKDLSVKHGSSWSGFKVLNEGTWYGKDSQGDNVTVGTIYSPTTSGGDNYCDFKANGLTYYFFFNTSTHKLMIQPKYYLAGNCGASNQNWGQTQNAPTYDATNGNFKWNTMSLTAGTSYKFKLCTYNTWDYYNYQDGGSVSVSQGDHETTDKDKNIIFTPTYGGVAVITMVPTTNAMVVHCPYQVSYNKGANGTGSNTSASKTWKTNLTLLGATFTRAGYTQDGWSTSDGGDKVYDLGGSYTTDDNVTLYPHWVENMSTVTLTASPSSKGTFTVGSTPNQTSTTAGVTTTRSVTAVPISGHHFVSWAISGGATISSTTTNPTTVTGDGTGDAATLTATFAADDVYTLTVAAGTGISSVTGTTNNIKAGNNIAISATVAAGYTWNTWTKTGAGTLSSFTAGTKDQTVTIGTAGDITLTASATEDKVTLVPTVSYNHGSSTYTATSSNTLGVATSTTLTASTPNAAHYTFAGWTLTNLTVTSGNAASDLSITVKVTDPASECSAVANYNEVLTQTTWVIKGGSAFGGTAWETEHALAKESGASTSDIVYATFNIAAANTGDSNADYKFKLVKNGSPDAYFGLSASGQYYLQRGESGTEKTLTDAQDIELRADRVGAYIFKVDYSDASNPILTVTFPVDDAVVYMDNGESDSYAVNTNQIFVKAHVTDDGMAGASASDLTAVGFKIGETTYPATCMEGSYFWRYITGLTEGTEYTVQAYATNSKGTVYSGDPAATATITTRAAGTTTIHVRSAVGRTAPVIYAYTDESSSGCGAAAKIENSTWPGASMGLPTITGTVYNWYQYNISNEYNYFIINEGGTSDEANAVKTDDIANPLTETCYWYDATATNADSDHKRLGAMTCPSTDPRLMIDDGSGKEETFEYYTMTAVGMSAEEKQYAITLRAKTTYHFKPVYNAEWYGKAATTLTRTTYTAPSLSASDEANLNITTDAEGTYTFKFNTSTKAIEVVYPDAYTVTFDADAGGVCTGITASATSAGGTMTSGDYVAKDDDVTFTETHKAGYTFVGWFDAASGGSAVAKMGVEDPVLEDIRANAAVYPHYTENMTTVSLVANGNGKIQYWDGDSWEDADATITAGVSTTRRLQAVPDEGYYLSGWTKTEGTDYDIDKDGEDYEIVLTGVGTGESSGQTLTANFVELNKIYFRNVNGETGEALWDSVYVGFDPYWDTDNTPSKGAGVKGKTSYGMNKMGSTNIWWAYIPRWFTKDNYTKVAFFDKGKMSNWNNFYENNAVNRSDYNALLNMYVPNHTPSDPYNKTTYYSNGYWKNYGLAPGAEAGYYMKRLNSSSNGYEDAATDCKFVVVDENTISYKLRVDNMGTDYHNKYMVHSAGAIKYVTHTVSESEGTAITTDACTDVNMTQYDDGTPRFLITPSSEGYYTITIDQSGDVMKISVNYPVAVGDYLLVQTNSDESKILSHSDIIKGGLTTATVSMHLDMVTSGTKLILKKCTSTAGGTPTFGAKTEVGTGTGLFNTTTFNKGNGVYKFDITISGDEVTAIASDGLYTGKYYIKTDYAPGRWVNFKQNVLEQNTINFSKEDANTFDYYHCAWVDGDGKNVKCIIANDYNEQLTDTLIGDGILGEDNGKPRQYLATAANVRFSYNSYTNELKRAYINGASGWEASFLSLKDMSTTNTITKTDGTALTNDTVSFRDKGNWIYQIDVNAGANSYIWLSANYKFSGNDHMQNLIGTNTTGDQLIGSGLTSPQRMTLIYDFKTNNLIAAWTPAETKYGIEIDLNSDVLLIHNRMEDGTDEVNIIDLTEGGKIKNIDRVYSALRFQKTNADGIIGLSGDYASTAESYYRYNYWISFPYDVKMTDIFGVADYGSKWRIQYYDGAERANKGWYLGDGTATFWKTLPMNEDAVLHKGEGYVLQLSPSAFKATGAGSLWALVDEIYLYFPSKANFGHVILDNSTVELTSLPCTKGLYTDGTGKNHNLTDSHWHVFGIPTFKDATGTTGTGDYYYDGNSDGDQEAHVISGEDFYFYKYNNTGAADYNTYTVTSSLGYTFQPMHAYMIQMTGTLNFAINSVPSSVAARQKKEIQNYDLRLELASEGQVADQTFVTLRENAVADFALNEDLTKIHNTGKTNIYSYAGVYDVAANILPVENRTVVLGVETAKSGTYTFSIPDNFDGTVTLIDNFTQTRTNLALGDYEVSLPKGEINDRFLLEINIRQVPTAIDGVEGGSLKDDKAHKFIENGVMYILRDGKIYDARGNKVK